eukprot:PhF_6_TR33672/c0_g2_i1/m.49300
MSESKNQSILKGTSLLLDVTVRQPSEGGTSPSMRARVIGLNPEDALNTLSPNSRQIREKVHGVKSQRRFFFTAFETPMSSRLSHMKAGHFGVLAMSLSFLGKTSVTVEDIFKAAQMPLEYINYPSMTLAELYDVTILFLKNDARFGAKSFEAELVHMDTTVASGEVGHGYLAMETSHRCVVETLADFREGLETEVTSMDVVRIVNYDPVVVEQGLMILDEDSDDSHDGIANMVISPSVQRIKANQIKSKSRRDNQGGFGVVVDYNTTQHLVRLAGATLDADIHAVEVEAPISTLYKAICKDNEYVGRPRGYIRLRRRIASEPVTPVTVAPLDFGYRTVRQATAPYMIALAHALRKWFNGGRSSLKSIISDIVRKVGVPIDLYLLRNASLEIAQNVLETYLMKSGLSSQITHEVLSINTKLECKEDSQTTLSIMELDSYLTQATNNGHMVVALVDMNIALNVMGVDTHHWVLVQSYDSELQTAVMLDTNPKKYTSSWLISLERLHRALVKRGMITLSSIAATPPSSAITPKPTTAVTTSTYISSYLAGVFEFPSTPLPITLMAFALTKLGHFTTVDTLLFRSLWVDVSDLLGAQYSVMDSVKILRKYLTDNNLSDIECTAVIMEPDRSNQKKLGMHGFFADMKSYAMDPSTQVIFHYSKSILPYGCLNHALLVDFLETEEMVVLCDANPNRGLRFLKVPLSDLFNALQDISTIARRSHGFVVLRKVAAATSASSQVTQRFVDDGSVISVPGRSPFLVQISPHLSTVAFALTRLGIQCSAEDIFYNNCSPGFGTLTLAGLREKLTIQSLEDILKQFASKNVRVSQITAKEEIQSLLCSPPVQGSPSATLILYATQIIHNTSLKSTGVALTSGCTVSGGQQRVWLLNAEPTTWGDVVDVPVDLVLEAVMGGPAVGVLRLCIT